MVTEDKSQPSELIAGIILNVLGLTDNMTKGVEAVNLRKDAFPNTWRAQLAGIGLYGPSREYSDKLLDQRWSDEDRKTNRLFNFDVIPEIIIGGGYHAAVYAATRVMAGFPKPYVLEQSDRVGGTFAMTENPTFYLNSPNRAGMGGLGGDRGANLNYLPGAPVQVNMITMAKYPTNTDMAWVIRTTLAQFAEVITGVKVQEVVGNGSTIRVTGTLLEREFNLPTSRVIDARGLGNPNSSDLANGSTILTFPQLMSRMSGMWPLQGLRRVAVLGGGDSGKCAIEALCGLSPSPVMASAALDVIDRIDWYATDIPDNCEDWIDSVRGRYAGIGRFLRPDRYGRQLLNVVSNRNASPVSLPEGPTINGQQYDLVACCTGNSENAISGLFGGDFNSYIPPGQNYPVATLSYDFKAFRVGPHAYLGFNQFEREIGIAEIPQNSVSMFRTGTKTAILAATLPGFNL